MSPNITTNCYGFATGCHKLYFSSVGDVSLKRLETLFYTKNAYNQHGFSNVTYTTALPRQMPTTKLPTIHS